MSDEIDTGGGGGDDGGDAWLISYADMMTLVACFFILMMAFANFDPPTFKRKAEQVAKNFKGTNVQEEEDIMKDLAVEINATSDMEKLEVKQNPDGIEVVFNVHNLFGSGSAKLKKEAFGTVEAVAKIVKRKGNKFRVLFEGHTDHVPLGGRSIYPTNWELSSARASSMLRVFEDVGYTRNNLIAIGYADTKPVAPNKNPDGSLNRENMASNRRVVLKVLYPVGESTKLGLGVFFDQADKVK